MSFGQELSFISRVGISRSLYIPYILPNDAMLQVELLLFHHGASFGCLSSMSMSGMAVTPSSLSSGTVASTVVRVLEVDLWCWL